MPALPATRPSQEEDVACVTVACANFYGGCIAMPRRDAVVQLYQFDPESNQEGEAPEEVPTAAAAGCLNMLVCSFVLLQLLPCS